MLIGPNPFADLLQSVDGAHRLGEVEVRGLPTEVVSLQLEDPIEQSEVRLYIGKADGLLHRMEIEWIPLKLHEGPIKVGSKLDALLDAGKPPPLPQGDALPFPASPTLPLETPPPKPQRPVGSFVAFRERSVAVAAFPPGTFTFTPPKDRLMLGDAGPETSDDRNSASPRWPKTSGRSGRRCSATARTDQTHFAFTREVRGETR